MRLIDRENFLFSARKEVFCLFVGLGPVRYVAKWNSLERITQFRKGHLHICPKMSRRFFYWCSMCLQKSKGENLFSSPMKSKKEKPLKNNELCYRSLIHLPGCQSYWACKIQLRGDRRTFLLCPPLNKCLGQSPFRLETSLCFIKYEPEINKEPNLPSHPLIIKWCITYREKNIKTFLTQKYLTFLWEKGTFSSISYRSIGKIFSKTADVPPSHNVCDG